MRSGTLCDLFREKQKCWETMRERDEMKKSKKTKHQFSVCARLISVTQYLD